MEQNIVIKQINSLREFARDVLHYIFEIDNFSRLKENKILVNYGSPVDDFNESSIGFLLEIKYTEKEISHLMTPINLEGLFYWCDDTSWISHMKKLEKDDIFFMNDRPYVFSRTEWTDKAECYPDETLKYPLIKDLRKLIDLYYPWLSIEKDIDRYILTRL